MKLITYHFNPKLFLYLVLGFVLCTIIGTVTHELGHAAATSLQGRGWKLHYDSMSPAKSKFIDEFNAAYEKDKDKIKSKTSSPEKEAFLKLKVDLLKQYKYEDLLMRLGGPLQTMLTGTVGVFFLWMSRRKKQNNYALSIKEWVLVLIGFFWSRQLGILLQKIYYTIIGHQGKGDEEKIARHLHLNQWTVITIWGIMGMFILIWVTFYAIPLQQRLTFITAGLTGSLLGAVLWFAFLGPVLLP